MKDMRSPDYQDRITEEAADWFVRLQDTELSSEARQAFAHWLCASPEHVREYLSLTSLRTDINELPASLSDTELIEKARTALETNIVSLPSRNTPLSDDSASHPISEEQRQQHSRPRSIDRPGVFRYSAFAASCILALLAGLWWHSSDPNGVSYNTGIGEQKSFPLPDGSVVILNAVSKLRLHYTKDHRDVELLSGEALFTVAKSPNRPFRVLSGSSEIQAIGTRFNVYHRHTDTTVTVVEGAVEIQKSTTGGIPLLPVPSATQQGKAKDLQAERAGAALPVRLTKGQQARIDSSDAPIKVSAVDAAVDTAWQERRLIFESRPLGEVVSEFNLYNKTPIEIADPSLKEVHVSGAFYANDPHSFALFLDEAGIAKLATESADRILILPSHTPPDGQDGVTAAGTKSKSR